MTYEVIGYADEAAFNAVQFVEIDDGLLNKREALNLGRSALVEFPIVKVQSDDREFIEILRR